MESAAVDQLFARIQRHMHSEYSRQVDVFREIDTDDSGTLTAVELQRALSQMEGGSAPTSIWRGITQSKRSINAMIHLKSFTPQPTE